MKTVLIFGSQGSLGIELVKTYRANGWRVQEVTRENCDFKTPAHVEEFCRTWLNQNQHLDQCIFAVGKLYAGWVQDLPSSAWRDSASINAASPLLITRILQNNLPQPPKFIYLGSGASEVIVPGLLPYAMAKGLLKETVRAFRLELGGAFQALWVWPGGIESRFNQKAELFGGFVPPRQRSSRPPQILAEMIFKASLSDRKTLTVSALPVWMGRLQRLCPGLVNWLLKLHQS